MKITIVDTFSPLTLIGGGQITSNDVHTAIAFMTTRVQQPDVNDWKKMKIEEEVAVLQEVALEL